MTQKESPEPGHFSQGDPAGAQERADSMVHHSDRACAPTCPRDPVIQRKRELANSPSLVPQLRTLRRLGYPGPVCSQLHAIELLAYLQGGGGRHE